MHITNNSTRGVHPNWKFLSCIYLIIGISLAIQGIRFYIIIAHAPASIELFTVIRFVSIIVADVFGMAVSFILAGLLFQRKAIHIPLAMVLYVAVLLLHIMLLFVHFRSYVIGGIAWMFGYAFVILLPILRQGIKR